MKIYNFEMVILVQCLMTIFVILGALIVEYLFFTKKIQTKFFGLKLKKSSRTDTIKQLKQLNFDINDSVSNQITISDEIYYFNLEWDKVIFKFNNDNNLCSILFLKEKAEYDDLDKFYNIVNYPRTKYSLASDFIEECPFKRLGLLSSPSV